jgi:hypothetical protein
MEISDSIEVHTVELTKYNLSEGTISEATAIEQWAFFFLFADRYEPERLRQLLPGVEFQRAITAIEAIAAKTEDRFVPSGSTIRRTSIPSVARCFGFGLGYWASRVCWCIRCARS